MNGRESETGPVRVLIVDDSRDTAECLQMIISNQGYDAQVAFDGKQALAIAAEFSPDVAILDICLPELDGFQVARRLRQASHPAQMTLVALTGLMGYVDAELSQYQDFDEHLMKPVQPNDILKLLAKISAQSRPKPILLTP